jgi:hypothetical protein
MAGEAIPIAMHASAVPPTDPSEVIPSHSGRGARASRPAQTTPIT